ncbi:MAG TPA: NAD(P)/FAD-dependent oxidoreductase [Streptomyces sp.]
MNDSPPPVVVLADANPLRRHDAAALLSRWCPAGFRVLHSGSPRDSAGLLRTLAAEGSAVAAVVCDAGLDDGPEPALLKEAAALHPGARLLLVGASGSSAQAGTVVAVSRDGDGTAALPGRLRMVLDDALCSWNTECSGGAPSAEVRGHRFAPSSYQVRDFLERSGVLFHWTPAEHEDEPAVTVRLPDGSVLADPSISELAERFELISPASRDHYDVVVVGGGPGGLSSGVYAAVEGMSTLVIEDDCPGGQAGSTSHIENYLGFPIGLSGGDLAQRALQQALRAGVEWQPTRVATRLVPGEGLHRVEFVKAGGTETASVTAAAVVVATGVEWNRLRVPGVERLVDSGVYYGACLSDAPSTAGEDVYMVGAGNSAGQAALYFARHARSVNLLVRGETVGSSMSRYLVDRIEKDARIRVLYRTQVTECLGENTLSGLRLQDGDGTERTVPTRALYILIGGTPSTDWLHGAVALDERGYIRTGTEAAGSPSSLPMQTSVPGVFAVGDVRSGSVKRVGAAVGEGAAVAQCLLEYRRTFPDRFGVPVEICGSP